MIEIAAQTEVEEDDSTYTLSDDEVFVTKEPERLSPSIVEEEKEEEENTKLTLLRYETNVTRISKGTP